MVKRGMKKKKKIDPTSASTESAPSAASSLPDMSRFTSDGGAFDSSATRSRCERASAKVALTAKPAKYSA